MSPKKIRIVTHSGKFHADDVFSVAALFLSLGDGNVEVIRTRDDTIISTGDIVVDVGNVNDASTKRFDHHQEEGGGRRDNGVPYASFGLVWKTYGEEICGDAGIAAAVDRDLVQSIDANDNGVDICMPGVQGVFPFGIGSVIDLFRPTHLEGENYDEAFMRAVAWARWVLERLIKITRDAGSGKELVKSFYAAAKDKRLVIFDMSNVLGRELTTSFLMEYPEVLYAVIYRKDVDSWQLIAINETEGTYRVRKPLPEHWAGKRDGEFVELTGVADALFCHRGLFMAVAKSKEGAIALAEIALAQ